MDNTKKSSVYDIIKYISVLLVVLAHSTRMYTPVGAIIPKNGSEMLSRFTTYIYQFHMPLFILISGAVFGLCLEKGKYSNIPGFIANKAKRLLIPYFFFGFAYVAPVMCLLQLTDQSFLEYCYKGIILSLNTRHLWYILALFFIFILAILIKPLLTKSRTSRFLVVAFSLILYLVSPKLPSEVQLSNTCNYQLFFFLGVVLNYEYTIIEKCFNKLFILFCLTPFALAGMFFFNPNRLTNICYIFIGILMIVFLGFCIEKMFTAFTKTYIYRIINKNSFGIYLFHPMIIYALYYFLGDFNINPYLLSIGIALVSLVVSIIATELMRVLRLYVLIGESGKRRNK